MLQAVYTTIGISVFSFVL